MSERLDVILSDLGELKRYCECEKGTPTFSHDKVAASLARIIEKVKLEKDQVEFPAVWEIAEGWTIDSDDFEPT